MPLCLCSKQKHEMRAFRVTSLSCSLHRCTRRAIPWLSAILKFREGMKNTRLFPPVVAEEESPYPRHVCLLWSRELNACLHRGGIILLGGKLKLKLMRRSARDTWTEGCCCVESKAGWHSASESSHDLGNSMSVATAVQGGQVTTPCSQCTFQSSPSTGYSNIIKDFTQCSCFS